MPNLDSCHYQGSFPQLAIHGIVEVAADRFSIWQLTFYQTGSGLGSLSVNHGYIPIIICTHLSPTRFCIIFQGMWDLLHSHLLMQIHHPAPLDSKKTLNYLANIILNKICWNHHCHYLPFMVLCSMQQLLFNRMLAKFLSI